MAKVNISRDIFIGVRRFVLIALSCAVILSSAAFAQTAAGPLSPTLFRIGEKLTYTVDYQNFQNVGFIQTSVVSRGMIAKRDAVELRMRLKTNGIVSAAISLIDEDRTVYAAADGGEPLQIRRTLLSGILPKETLTDLTNSSDGSFDLLTALYRARESGGNGTFTIAEDDVRSTVTLTPAGTEKIETDAGTFDCAVSTVQGTYLDTFGIKEMKILFSTDQYHIPVAFRFKNAKGEFRGKLTGIVVDSPADEAARSTPTPTPSIDPTPIPGIPGIPTGTPNRTTKPTVTPTPYIPNRPLLPELVFDLGEELRYSVTRAGKKVGEITLSAPERKLLNNIDTLMLGVKVTGVEPNGPPFGLGDQITAAVDPDTLAPRYYETKLTGALSSLSSMVTFDQRTGNVTFADKRVEGPIGVHSLLSLIYAMRSFNLKPSKDLSNPVNDTRVAVFWSNKVSIFILRPSNIESIMLGGQKVAAQQIVLVTGDPQLDQLGFKIWLSPEGACVPLRFVIGGYQADLISQDNILKTAN